MRNTYVPHAFSTAAGPLAAMRMPKASEMFGALLTIALFAVLALSVSQSPSIPVADSIEPVLPGWSSDTGEIARVGSPGSGVRCDIYFASGAAWHSGLAYGDSYSAGRAIESECPLTWTGGGSSAAPVSDRRSMSRTATSLTANASVEIFEGTDAEVQDGLA